MWTTPMVSSGKDRSDPVGTRHTLKISHKNAPSRGRKKRSMGARRDINPITELKETGGKNSYLRRTKATGAIGNQ